MRRSMLAMIGAATLLISPAAAQTACPATDIDAVRLIEQTDAFSDASIRDWAKCPSMAARIFAASVLGDSEPTAENLAAIIDLLYDSDFEVHTQAVSAVFRHSAAMQPLLRARIDDATPMDHDSPLVRGDLALALLLAMEAEGVPDSALAVRSRLSAEDLDTLTFELQDYSQASVAHASMLAQAVQTSSRPEFFFEFDVYSSDAEIQKAYQAVRSDAWGRIVREQRIDAQLRSLPSLVVNGWPSDSAGYPEDRAMLASFSSTKLLDLASMAGGAELALALKESSLPGTWGAAAQARLDGIGRVHVFTMIRNGRFFEAADMVRAFARERDGSALAEAYLTGLGASYLNDWSTRSLLEQHPGVAAALQSAAVGGPRAELAQAVLVCGDPNADSPYYGWFEHPACGEAARLASGLAPRDAIDAAIAMGQPCRAVMIGVAAGEAGRASLRDIYTKIQRLEPLGPLESLVAQEVDCGFARSFKQLLEQALQVVDSEGLELAEAAEPEPFPTQPPGTLEALSWYELRCPGDEAWTENARPRTTDALERFAEDSMCLRSPSRDLIAAFHSAYAALLGRTKGYLAARVPSQKGFSRSVPPAPEPPPHQHWPELELPVIRAMPKPSLEVGLLVDRLGGRQQTLGQLQQRLEDALRRASPGYETGLFGDGRGGFILLAKRERIHADGRPFDEARRFTEQGNPQDSLWSILGEIMGDKPGQFRVVALVVSDRVNFDPGMSPNALPIGYIGTVRRMPPEMANQKVGNREITGLVYAFERPAGKPFRPKMSGSPNAYQHLLASGLWTALGLPQ